VLGRRGRQFRQPSQLSVGRFARFLGQVGRLDFLLEFLDFGGLLVFFAELVLNRFQLLAEEELALAFVDFRLDLGLDLGAELDDLELAGEDLRQPAQALGDVELLEQRAADGAGDLLDLVVATVPGPVGLVLLDGWKDLYVPVLELLEPKLSPGALVIADDSSFASVAGYLAYVRDPARGYVTVSFPVEDGMEISSWTGGN